MMKIRLREQTLRYNPIGVWKDEPPNIRDRLVEQGEKLFQSPKQVIQFTEDTNANVLSNDLVDYPHAFVLACVMDRQVKPKLKGRSNETLAGK